MATKPDPRSARGENAAKPPNARSENAAKPPKRGRGRPGLPPEVARARLIDAAEVCFERAAYADVGVMEIVREARMSSRTFYQHFDSKVDLAMALTDARAEVYLQTIERAVAEATTIIEGVDRCVTAFLSDLPVVVLDMRSLPGPDGDRVRKVFDGYRMRMGAAFLREISGAMKSGLVETIPDPLSVLIVVYGIEGLVMQTPRGPNRREALMALRPQILEALKKLFPEWLAEPVRIR